MIELSGIAKRYRAVTVADNVSVAFKQGGNTVLAGPNGAGKSKLVSIFEHPPRPGRRNGAY